MSFRIFFVPLGVAKVLKKSKVSRIVFHVSTEIHIFAVEKINNIPASTIIMT